MFEIRFPNTRESNKITQKKERSHSATIMPILLLAHVNIILTLLIPLGLHFPLINNKIESNLLTYRQKNDSIQLSQKTNSNYFKNHKPTWISSIKSVRSISHCVNVSKPSIPSSFSTQTSMFSIRIPHSPGR